MCSYRSGVITAKKTIFPFLNDFLTLTDQHSVNIVAKTTQSAVESVPSWLPRAKWLVVKWHKRDVGNASEENGCRYGIGLEKALEKCLGLQTHSWIGRNSPYPSSQDN